MNVEDDENWGVTNDDADLDYDCQPISLLTNDQLD
jgi:hypothetical protein